MSKQSRQQHSDAPEFDQLTISTTGYMFKISYAICLTNPHSYAIASHIHWYSIYRPLYLIKYTTRVLGSSCLADIAGIWQLKQLLFRKHGTVNTLSGSPQNLQGIYPEHILGIFSHYEDTGALLSKIQVCWHTMVLLRSLRDLIYLQTGAEQQHIHDVLGLYAVMAHKQSAADVELFCHSCW